MKTVANSLAELVSDIRFNNLPQEVVKETKRRVLDALGCAFRAGLHIDDGEPGLGANQQIAAGCESERSPRGSAARVEIGDGGKDAGHGGRRRRSGLENRFLDLAALGLGRRHRSPRRR